MDLRDHTRGGAYRGNRNDKNSLQGNITELGNNITNMDLQIRVKRFTRTTEAIANYIGREYGKEMKLLVKNHRKETEPKEPVMMGKEEAKSPSVMKKYKKIR
jgi:hypothetical protein